MKNYTILQCSFCGIYQKDNVFLRGMSANICNKCIVKGYNMINNNQQLFDDNVNQKIDDLKPINIKNYLDNYIIGQDIAKKKISVAIYNHYKRLYYDSLSEIDKSNIILVGSTGTGKTLIAQIISKILKVPFCICDATSLTEAGYVGDDVESILSRLLNVANNNIQLAEKGIIYIDEIDKIARKSYNPSITRDVSGEGVQQSLLKILEGTIVRISPHGGRKHPEQEMISINTKNILFICGGSFEGIENIIKNRIVKNSIGYNTNNNIEKHDNIIQYITSTDLKSFGIIPELIGRIPIIAHLNSLDRIMLKDIFIKPKNAIFNQYKKVFNCDNINLEITNNAVDYIIDEALKLNLGARGLKSILDKILMESMFNLPSNKRRKNLKIDTKYILKYKN